MKYKNSFRSFYQVWKIHFYMWCNLLWLMRLENYWNHIVSRAKIFIAQDSRLWKRFIKSYESVSKQTKVRFHHFALIVLSPCQEIGETRKKLGDDWRPIERLMILSAIILVIFFGGFGSWAAVAPLESAVVAPGKITVSSHRKSINHKEGGIIKQIFVKDGDNVSSGQILIQLDDTEAKVESQRLVVQKFDLLATKYRLLSEQSGTPFQKLNDISQTQKNNPMFLQSVEAQREIFDSRRENLFGRINILKQGATQLELEIEGYGSQIVSAGERKRLLGIEIKALRALYKRKLVGNQRLLQLRREVTEISGIEGELKAKIAATRKTIGETELKIIDHHNTFKTEVISELATVKSKLADVSKQIVLAESLLKRTAIVAPMDGVVVNLRVHTIDSSINPGAIILDLLPDNDVLMVQARISPLDIDVVRKDLPVRIFLTAYSSRFTLPMKGIVSHVSADSLVDQQSGELNFIAHIRTVPISSDSSNHIYLHPGMPAEVMIITGERTALDYLLDPIFNSFRHAGREQ